MKRYPKWLRLVGALLTLSLLTACPPRTGITSVTLEAPSSLSSGEVARLTATVQGRGSFNPGVIWSVEGGGTFADAAANPVDYTAPIVSAETTVRVTASAAGDAGKTATAVITVRPVEPLVYRVNPEVAPALATVPGKDGSPQPVAGSRDANGVQSDFVVGHVLIRSQSEAELTAFLQRYGGTVLSDDSIPEPPLGLGVTLTPEERRASEYLVRIELARVDLDAFEADAARVGMGGLLEVSSQDGLLTLAGATNALAAGFEVSPNYLSYPQQPFPTPLFRTEERPDGAGGFSDAFTTTRYQSSGSQSNVTLAWQFVAAHGIERRVWVAIIDEGFWLNPDGTPRGTDHDFPTAGPGTCVVAGVTAPCQYDFANDDFIADGPGAIGCGAGNLCFWHGTGAAGVAVGLLSNRMGAAGTGGLVADVMLFRRGATKDTRNRAIRTALAWGADVVSMSFGGDCDSVACRRFDRNNHPFRDAVGAGSRAVFVAAAGNGRDPDGAGPQPAVGYDVGEPNFVHPCLMDHVICVGALADDATTKIGYSNFGAGVDLFAPTNIPTMSYPNSTDGMGNPLPNAFGPAVPQTFGGTSAATPFVAGVAAMMKAINPELSSDEVNAILRDTAHRGTAPVDFYIDAYAAVRKAAEGREGVRDGLEPNSLTSPAPLMGAGPWNDLNLHSVQDRDHYRFESAQRATLRIDLAYPDGLGAIPWLGLDGSDACGLPVQTLDAPLPGGGRRYEYTVAAGPHVIGLGGGLISAYNLSLGFAAAAALPLDAYEANNTPTTARHLYSFKPKGDGLLASIGIDPRVTISANLHTAGDVDYYTVRGAEASLAEQVLLAAVPTVKVYGNESPVTLEVFTLGAGGAQGSLVGRVSSGRCDGVELSVALESGKSYLVRVSGGAGRYSLANGVGGEARRLPVLVRDRAYEILNPLDPITRVLRGPLVFVFVGDRSARTVSVQGAVRLALYDLEGTLLAEGTPSGGGERLGLEAVRHRGVYALEVTPQELSAEGTAMTLAWEEAAPLRRSENLIENPGAEEGPGNDEGGPVDYVDGWGVPSDDLGTPTVSYYNGVNGRPDVGDPGPEERGDRFFAGGPGHALAGIQQQFDVPGGWEAAVDEGGVKFALSGFLGGREEEADHATLSVTFFDSDFQELGKTTLGPVTPGEREGQTGLFAVGRSDEVPAGARYIYADLVFTRLEGDYNDGYADALELVLLEYEGQD